MRVLVVDDDPDVLATIEALLSKNGFDVTGCATADRANLRLAAKRFDILLIDESRLRTSDVELALRVREDGTPVLILAAAEDVLPTLKKIGLPYILKPIRDDELLTAVRALKRTEFPVAR